MEVIGNMAELGISPGPWYRPGKWYVSPYCYEEEVRANYDLPEKIYVRDITLSEGQHAMGTHFTLDGMVELARILTEVGVTTIKQHSGDFRPVEFTKRCADEAPEVKVSVLMGARSRSPKLQKLLDNFIDAGVYEVELLNLNIKDPKCMDLVSYIKGRGVEVTAGMTNTLRRPWEEVRDYFNTTLTLGISMMEVYDTYNVGTPDAVRYFIKKLKKATGARVPIHWQSHNDYGTGTACSVAAVEGGAAWLDLSAVGLGDRGGNGCLEEVVIILESMYGVKTGIKKDRLFELARLTEEKSGLKRDPLKAMVGEGAFFHESEAHAGGILKYASDTPYIARSEAFSPFVIGAKRNVRIGGTSLGLVPHRLEQLGLKYTDEHVSKIQDRIVDLWTKEKKDMSIEEFDAMARKVVQGD